MPEPNYRRYASWVLLGVVLWMPVAFVSAKRAILGNRNRVQEWLPKGMQETQRFRWFKRQFGSDEILLISWPGCALDEQAESSGAPSQLERLRSSLLQTPPGSEAPLFRQVKTGPEMLSQLQSPPLELSRQAALERLQGWLIGPDNRATAAVALVSSHGERDRAAAIDWVYQCAQKKCGVSPEQLRLAGSTVDGVAIDQASTETIAKLNPIAWVLGLLIAWLALGRSLRLALLVFGAAQLCSASTMAAIYWAGIQVNAVLLMVSTLAFVLTCSGAVHLVNYFRDAQRKTPTPATALASALRVAWKPSMLAALTTILGVGSLMLSRIPPIQNFGLFASLAVLLGLAIVFVVVPCCLQLWPGRATKSETNTSDSSRKGKGHQQSRFLSQISASRQWLRLAAFVIARRNAIAVAGGLLALCALWGASQVRTSVNLHRLLAPETKVLRDYRWVQDRIGPMVPMEIVLRFPNQAPQSMLQRLGIVKRASEYVRQQTHVGATITAATFAPESPRDGSMPSVIARVLYKRRLQNRRESLLESGFLAIDGDKELWRISLRVDADDRLDYGKFLSELEQSLGPRMAALQADEGVEFECEYCGGIPLINQAQRELLNDLYWSFGVAAMLVATVMIIVLRNVAAGLVSMIPNLLPALAVFGVMGIWGLPIEIGSMMTASVALGIAVDDTLHFVCWFRRQTARGRSRRSAVRSALRHCGPAMCQTSMICGLVFLVFSASDFVPTQRFAWIISSMLFAALAADLLLLPAILVGPLGRLFRASPQESASSQSPASQKSSLSLPASPEPEAP